MKFFIIVILMFVGCSNVVSQKLSPEVHWNDSVWIQDVEIGIDAYVKFKAHLLKFKSQKLELLFQSLDSDLIADLDSLDAIYKTELNKFRVEYSEFILEEQNKL